MIRFEEVTNNTGISYIGVSYGASWGDFNNDKYPDLYVINHGNPATLYLNQGNGTFLDVTSQVFLQELKGDTHGAAWGDFDNDGDQDLIQLVGGGRGFGTGPNQMYINNGGTLKDQASELGLDYPLSRGRTPLWLDFDKDGWLDLFTGASPRPDGQAPPTIFRQTEEGFEDARSTTGFDLSNSVFGFLSDLSGDGNLDGVFKSRPLNVYDVNSIPFEELVDIFVSRAIGNSDIISGDFNNDLRPDLYLTRRNGIGSDLVQDNPNSLKASIRSRGNEKGFQFDSVGRAKFDLALTSIPSLYPPIYIGASGFSPNGRTFTLSADDPEVQGIFPHNPGVDRGIYIGYDSELQQWQILASSPDVFELRALINTSEPISDLTAIGFDRNALPREDQLLINTEQGLIDQSQEAGINDIPIASKSIVSGDFDNDMDLDLYVLATGTAGNRPNILYENQGDGTFIAIADAGAATGTNLGVGDSVTTADYDLDGFLDLFVTNGDGPPELNRNAPYQLFRNQGNDNNWLAIDLEGVVSNRDGIGAQVFVTAGGVTQLREQSGGIHNKSQNHQRLHFGLADNRKVDEILVKWTNGAEQRIRNVPVNQLLHIIEPSESFSPGKPIYTVGAESGVFLWKDTFDGAYHLRTVGSEVATEFDINLISTDALLDITPFSLEANDQLTETDFGFSLNSKLFRFQDGVDFRLAPGAKALLSVTQDGIANPRQLHVGSEGTPLAPDGWIIDSADFPLQPDFTPGEDLGLFLGQDSSSEELKFRWNGDGNLHRTNLSVLSSQETTNFSPISFESHDTLTSLSNGVKVEGVVSIGFDGLDVTTSEPTQIGFTYEQDGLLQPHRVNSNAQDDLLGVPNAYWLPLATPYGKPQYDRTKESGLFLWKDQDLWHLRVTGGEEPSRRYVGSIVSDSPATLVEKVKLESNDQIDLSVPSRIDFDLRVFPGFEDGINFSFATGASLSLSLEGATEEVASVIHIGSEKWAVTSVPLDLSGW